MVVHHDNARGRLGDGGPKDLARMDQRAVEEAAGDQDLAQHLALAVQRQKVKLLDLEIAQPRLEQCVRRPRARGCAVRPAGLLPPGELRPRRPRVAAPPFPGPIPSIWRSSARGRMATRRSDPAPTSSRSRGEIERRPPAATGAEEDGRASSTLVSAAGPSDHRRSRGRSACGSAGNHAGTSCEGMRDAVGSAVSNSCGRGGSHSRPVSAPRSQPSARAKSAAPAKRSSGRFARAFTTACSTAGGTDGHTVLSGGIGLRHCPGEHRRRGWARRTAAGRLAFHKSHIPMSRCRCARRSRPRRRSARDSCMRVPKRESGRRQARPVDSDARAIPKSARMAWDSLSRMFSGLIRGG